MPIIYYSSTYYRLRMSIVIVMTWYLCCFVFELWWFWVGNVWQNWDCWCQNCLFQHQFATVKKSWKHVTEVSNFWQKWNITDRSDLFFLALSEVSFSVKICDRSVLCRLWDICSYPSFLKEFDNAFKLVVLYFLEMKINFLYSLFMSLITTSRAFSVC